MLLTTLNHLGNSCNVNLINITPTCHYWHPPYQYPLSYVPLALHYYLVSPRPYYAANYQQSIHS